MKIEFLGRKMSLDKGNDFNKCLYLRLKRQFEMAYRNQTRAIFDGDNATWAMHI